MKQSQPKINFCKMLAGIVAFSSILSISAAYADDSCPITVKLSDTSSSGYNDQGVYTFDFYYINSSGTAGPNPHLIQSFQCYSAPGTTTCTDTTMKLTVPLACSDVNFNRIVGQLTPNIQLASKGGVGAPQTSGKMFYYATDCSYHKPGQWTSGATLLMGTETTPDPNHDFIYNPSHMYSGC